MTLSKLTLLVDNSVKTVYKLYATCFVREYSVKSAKMDQNMESLIRQLAPPLTNDKHKGQAGRIGVFGGSLEYTGAPYFAAITSLKVGADLSHVFCAKEAAPVIKSYSPELIVHPLLDAVDAAKKIEPWLDRLHVILIGPGLGREDATFKVIEELLSMCRSRKKPLVIDADGLFFISLHPEILRDYPSPVILTPNIMEFARLIGSSNTDANKKEQSGNFLALAENITILCKGPKDEIFSKRRHVEVAGGGSARRCGGQGDLLSGAAAVFLTWAMENKSLGTGEDGDPGVVAGYAACRLTRRCNLKAFGKFGRSMTCSDMIGEIHKAFDVIFERK